jgi:hypothetical protein
MTRELSLPWIRAGAGFAWAEFSLGVTILWDCAEVSLHLGPFYAWVGAA